jgi:Tol biopolymer transport system component/DNA-binding winged helix-turn-helix (wHTH) protein
LLKEHQIYQFGEFTLDPVAKVAFRNGQPLHLTRKAVETLLVLVQNPGIVLTKDEIMAAVWPDRVVDEANLTQNIAVIRKALAAKSGEPGNIETFPARGYRFEGPVTTSAGSDRPIPEVSGLPTPVAPAQASGRQFPRWSVALAVLMVAGIAVTFWGSAGSPPREPRLRVVPVTRMPGKEFQPAISPDGTRLAFLWSQEGAPPVIWIRNLDREEAGSQLIAGEGHFSSPAWSHDGKSLAYLRVGSEATDVMIAATETGAERRIVRLTPPNYGYDNRLLDLSSDGESVVVAHADSPERPLRLLLISTRTGSVKPLLPPDSELASYVDPRFSPDGQQVSFLKSLHRSRQEVAVASVAGGTARELTSFATQISGHDWTGDGQSLYVASHGSGEFRIWRLAVNQPSKPSPLSVYGEFPIQLAAARRSDRMVYSLLHQDRNIWRLRLSDKSWERVIASTGQDASPQYSPDGSLVCFRSDRSGEEQLWVSKRDGSGAVQITRGPQRPSVGRWARDGNSIVFNNPITREIFVAARRPGGDWVTQGPRGSGVHPVFSADSQWIFAAGDGNIVRIPVQGGNAATLAGTAAESLNISPDGKYLYFVREPSATSLWRASVESGEVSKVLDGLVPACTSCWAVAPGGVYYLGTDNRSFDAQVLYFYDFRTQKAQSVVRYPEPLWPQGSGPFSLSPDGRDLLTVRVGPSNSDVMLVSPFE